MGNVLGQWRGPGDLGALKPETDDLMPWQIERVENALRNGLPLAAAAALIDDTPDKIRRFLEGEPELAALWKVQLERWRALCRR